MAAENLQRAELLAIDRNCWRIEHATRAGFLIDADAYFRAFVEAAQHARRSILIAGWDFHSRTRLLCADGKKCELELGRFLNDLMRQRRELQVHILIWDYPMIFGLDREWAPLYGLSWKPHRRICFRYDNTHPIGGSHHQKVVVIDDAIAFSGGIDLTSRRWDTCEHAPQNQHRVMAGAPYPPFHDMMMAVEGPAARALGDMNEWLPSSATLRDAHRISGRAARAGGVSVVRAVSRADAHLGAAGRGNGVDRSASHEAVAACVGSSAGEGSDRCGEIQKGLGTGD